MTIDLYPVSAAEHELIREHFEVKAKALALQTHFVNEDGEWVEKPLKNWFWAGYDASKYTKAVINGQTYIIAAGNIITGIIGDVLPEACQHYPESFGTHDAHAVVKAIYDEHPEPGYNNMDEYEQHLSFEQFAIVFHIDQDGNVDHKALRLDLFRQIKPEKGDKTKHEFIGGLLHALKHYTYNGFPLSTNHENFPLNHPTEIIGYIIDAFFQSPHTQSGKGWHTTTTMPSGYDLKCGYFQETVANVYFLNTAYVK